MKFSSKLINKIYYEIIFSRLVSANIFAKLRGVQFGKNCFFRTKNFGSEPYLIKMGNNVRTSTDVNFVTHDGGLYVLRHLYNEYKKADYFKPILIGNNVTIGLGSTVLYGTTIGNNVIIGAGSVVKGELKSNSVYAGIPARYICSIKEYIEKNKENFLYTKHLNSDEKKPILLEHFSEILYMREI